MRACLLAMHTPSTKDQLVGHALTLVAYRYAYTCMPTCMLQAEVGQVQLDYPAVLTRQRIVLRNVPTGTLR